MILDSDGGDDDEKEAKGEQIGRGRGRGGGGGRRRVKFSTVRQLRSCELLEPASHPGRCTGYLYCGGGDSTARFADHYPIEIHSQQDLPWLATCNGNVIHLHALQTSSSMDCIGCCVDISLSPSPYSDLPHNMALQGDGCKVETSLTEFHVIFVR